MYITALDRGSGRSMPSQKEGSLLGFVFSSLYSFSFLGTLCRRAGEEGLAQGQAGGCPRPEPARRTPTLRQHRTRQAAAARPGRRPLSPQPTSVRSTHTSPTRPVPRVQLQRDGHLMEAALGRERPRARPAAGEGRGRRGGGGPRAASSETEPRALGERARA